MTATVQNPMNRPAAPQAASSTWRMSWSGLRTVAVLELRQRVRSTRWIVVLVLWFVVLLGLTLLVRGAVHASLDPIEGEPSVTRHQLDEYTAASVFGIVVFLVLGLGGLVAPALTATSINGDRSAGVLAALQTTLLTPAEIAVGKLLAAWVTAMALLAAALPVLGWAYLGGGTPGTRLLTTLAVLALTLLVVCAAGLGWSAVAARSSSSTVLTYLTVLFLGLGLPILFAVTAPLIQETRQVQVSHLQDPELDAAGNPTGPGNCVPSTESRTDIRTDRTWWLLAANPFVVVADSAPPVRLNGGFGIGEPLTAIRDAVRGLRLGPEAVVDECFGSEESFQQAERARQQAADALPATWPYGLGLDLALGAVFTVVAVRRLRAPARTLPRGTRVA
jgi:ABC-type transport system involved in multi-copper enzyme maturation permease subunit